MIKTKGVVHFSLPVTDIEKSTKFYTEILGMEISEKREKIVFLRTGNDHFMLTKSDNPIEWSVGDETRCHHAFWVEAEKYDEYVAFLKSKDIRILYEEDRPPPANFSGRRAYFHDPDNHVLEILDWTNPTK